MREGKGIKIIEWDDLNKKKFYMNSLALATSIRTCIYPLNLVKTRLQVYKFCYCNFELTVNKIL